ncbi:hypothetical protein OSTOST_12364, partial [Ostertagia ostertagi]
KTAFLGGVAGGPGGSGEAGKPYLACSGSDTNATGDSTRERRSGGATEGCSSTGQQHLCPIPEMTHLDSNRGECLRAKLLHRSHTAERIAKDWASVYTKDYVQEISCFGTPPRDVANISPGENRNGVDCWIHSLKRTRSDDGMQLAHCCDSESLGDSVFDIPAESVLSSVSDILERNSDSGCSSEKVFKNPKKESKPESCELTSLSSLHPMLLYDQPRREKVDIWLRSTHFI